MKLTSILNPDFIVCNLEATDRQSAYKAIASQIVAKSELKFDPDELVNEMIVREDSIRIPYAEIAMPHIRIDQIHDLYMGVGILKSPLMLKDYDAAPSKVIIMSLVSDNTSDTYLKALSAFAKYLSVPANFAKLNGCGNAQAVLDNLNHDNVRLKKDITAEDIMSNAADTVTPESPLRDALDRFVRARTSCLPVVDKHGTLLGAIDAAEIIHKAIPEYLFMMNHVKFLSSFEPFERIFREEYSQKVEEYMTQPKLIISPDTPLIQITMSLIRGEAQTIFVTGENNHYLGMISIEDIVHKILRG